MGTAWTHRGLLASLVVLWGCGPDPAATPPAISAVSPAEVEVGTAATLTIEGSGFRVPLVTALSGAEPAPPELRVTLGGRPLSEVVVVGPDRITARLEPGLALGPHAVVVTLVDGTWARLGAAVTVVPAPAVALAFTDPAPRLESGACSAPVEVQLRDRSGEPAAATAPVTVRPTSSDGTFRTFAPDDAGCEDALTDFLIPPGATSARFRVRTGPAGVHGLGAEAEGLAPAWQDWEVTSPTERAPDTWLHLGGRTTVAPGETLPVTVAATTDGAHRVARLEVEAVGAAAASAVLEGDPPGGRLTAGLPVPQGARTGARIYLLAEARDELGRRGYAAAEVTVGSPEPVALVCTVPPAGAVVGERVRVSARLTRTDGRTVEVAEAAAWSVTPAGRGRVEAGVLEAQEAGPTTLTARWGALEASCELAIREETLRVWPPRVLLGPGGTGALTLEAWTAEGWTPAGPTVWTSDGPERVAVDGGGGLLAAAGLTEAGTPVVVRGCLEAQPGRCATAAVRAGSRIELDDALWIQGHQVFAQVRLGAGAALRADATPVVLEVTDALEVEAGARVEGDGGPARPGAGWGGRPGPGGGQGGDGGLPAGDGAVGGGPGGGAGGQAGSLPGAGGGGAHWGPGGAGGGGTPGGVPPVEGEWSRGAGGGGGAGSLTGAGGGGGGGGGDLTLLAGPEALVRIDGVVSVRGGDGRRGTATGGGGGAGGALHLWTGGAPVLGTGLLRVGGGHGGGSDSGRGGCAAGGGGAGGVVEVDGPLAPTLRVDLLGGLGGGPCTDGTGGRPGGRGALTFLP